MAEKTFKGQPILSGELEGPAMVSHIGFNTLSSYKAITLGGVILVILNFSFYKSAKQLLEME